MDDPAAVSARLEAAANAAELLFELNSMGTELDGVSDEVGGGASSNPGLKTPPNFFQSSIVKRMITALSLLNPLSSLSLRHYNKVRSELTSVCNDHLNVIAQGVERLATRLDEATLARAIAVAEQLVGALGRAAQTEYNTSG